MKPTKKRQREIKVTNCNCCKKTIELFANNQYCTSCKLYTLKLRSKIANLQAQVKTLRIKIYGSPNGQQRTAYARIKKAGAELPWNVWNDHNAKAPCDNCQKFFSTKRLVRIRDKYYCARCKKTLSPPRDLDRGGVTLNPPSKIPRGIKLKGRFHESF